MDTQERMARLYNKDTKAGYANLLEMEDISRRSDVFYPCLNEFIAMLQSESYVVRVRGFRLLCLQAQWDTKNKHIDENTGAILAALQDNKPTAVRQMLMYLGFLAPYKPQLRGEIQDAMARIDLSKLKDTMAPLIGKDMEKLNKILDGLEDM